MWTECGLEPEGPGRGPHSGPRGVRSGPLASGPRLRPQPWVPGLSHPPLAGESHAGRDRSCPEHHRVLPQHLARAGPE